MSGFQFCAVYVKSGPGVLFTSTIEAKEEVRTMRFTFVPALAEAFRIDFTPLIAGRISSSSLFVVL